MSSSTPWPGSNFPPRRRSAARRSWPPPGRARAGTRRSHVSRWRRHRGGAPHSPCSFGRMASGWSSAAPISTAAGSPGTEPGEMTPDPAINVLGGPLDPCSEKPPTGFFRDGACNTCAEDRGSHTVCAVMTAEFLAYSKYVGNDLSTPRPEYRFAGLKAGDRWCLCAGGSCRPPRRGRGRGSTLPPPIGGRSTSCRSTCSRRMRARARQSGTAPSGGRCRRG